MISTFCIFHFFEFLYIFCRKAFKAILPKDSSISKSLIFLQWSQDIQLEVLLGFESFQ